MRSAQALLFASNCVISRTAHHRSCFERPDTREIVRDVLQLVKLHGALRVSHSQNKMLEPTYTGCTPIRRLRRIVDRRSSIVKFMNQIGLLYLPPLV